MEELKKLVCKLEKATGENEQIGVLQKIGEKLVSEYEIRIFNLTIRPLWVEAYYYHQEHFPDCNTHMSEKQKGPEHFGHIYFHDNGRGGFDLCLSKGDYYLSFLLKATLINQKFCKQTDIYEILDKTGYSIQKIENETGIVHKLEHIDEKEEFICAKRVNLKKSCYVDALLAVVPRSALAVPEHDFEFAHKSLLETVYEYMKDYIASHPDLSKKEYKTECTKTFGWCPDTIETLLKGVK